MDGTVENSCLRPLANHRPSWRCRGQPAFEHPPVWPLLSLASWRFDAGLPRPYRVCARNVHGRVTHTPNITTPTKRDISPPIWIRFKPRLKLSNHANQAKILDAGISSAGCLHDKGLPLRRHTIPGKLCCFVNSTSFAP
jgi:hypothetical protein